jgi:hypothetical protein
MQRSKLLIIGLFVTFLLLFATSFLLGQTSGTGALSGTVKDSTGAVIPDAAVTLTSTSTGQSRTVTTGPYGLYNFQLLPPGEYTLTAEKSGFKKLVHPSITITVTQVTSLESVLEVGGGNETVTVTAGIEAIQTSSSTVGTLIDSKAVVDMPLSTRNYLMLLGLAAGANASVNNATALGKGSQDVSVNGSSSQNNNYQMDGVQINNSTSNGTAEQGANSGIGIPNPDALQEFKIQTSGYDAGYGRNSGASVNVVTKSGTNEFHGTLFEFFRNTALNANEFFNKDSQLRQDLENKQARLDQHQFGGVFGGPIKKDKLFFFVSYQETRQKNGVSGYGSSTGVILPPIPQGDRSTPAFQAALGAAMCHQPTFAKIIGIGSAELVACDGSNINPVAMNMLNLELANGNYYIPSPTVSGPIAYSIPAIYKEHQAMGNWDWVITPKQTLSGKYFYAIDPTVAPFPGSGLGFPGPNVPGNPVSWEYGSHNANLKLTSALTTSIVNEALMAYQRYTINNTNDIPFTATEVGMTPVQSDLPKLPTLWFLPIGSPVTFAIGSHPFYGNDAAINQYIWSDQVSWATGKHTIRFGGEIEKDQWNWIFNSLAEGACVVWPTFPDFLIGKPAFQNGTPFSNIINIPNFATRGPAGGIDKYYRSGAYSWFFQDDIRLTSNLTINAGLRWEYFAGLSEAKGAWSNISPAVINAAGATPTSSETATFAGYVVPANYTGPALPSGVTELTANSIYGDPSKLGFAPRVGFAWQPTSGGRWVIRGGGGIFYDRLNMLSVGQAAEQSQPFARTLPFSWFGYQGSLASPFDQTPTGWNEKRWFDPVTLQGSNIQATATDLDMPTPSVYNWNLNTQFNFLKTWVLEIGYVGSHGIHIFNDAVPYNAAPLASAANPINGITTNTQQNAPGRVPLLGISPASKQEGADGALKYNALQATVRKQFSQGLDLQANYTFSRAFTTIGGAKPNWNPSDFRNHYGPNPGYRPHRFTVTYTYQFPYADGTGFLKRMFGGWSWSGVTVIQNGSPLTITDGSGGTVYFAGTSGVVSANAQFAPGMEPANVKNPGDLSDLVGSCMNGGACYLNKSAFTKVPNTGASGDTLWGNSGYGIVLGPGQHNWDMTLQKTTRVGGISEDATLLFRAEFFNAFNHPQFTNPNTDFNSGNLGLITKSSVNPRLIQFVLKYQF